VTVFVGGQFRFPARGHLVGSHLAANVTKGDLMVLENQQAPAEQRGIITL